MEHSLFDWIADLIQFFIFVGIPIICVWGSR